MARQEKMQTAYTDDLVVRATALAVIAVCVLLKTKAAAKAKSREWFPE